MLRCWFCGRHSGRHRDLAGDSEILRIAGARALRPCGEVDVGATGAEAVTVINAARSLPRQLWCRVAGAGVREGWRQEGRHWQGISYRLGHIAEHMLVGVVDVGT